MDGELGVQAPSQGSTGAILAVSAPGGEKKETKLDSWAICLFNISTNSQNGHITVNAILTDKR